MPKTKISEFDVNPDNNTDINSINIAEGCAPSGINNAIRQLMSDLKEQQTGASGDSFTVGGNLAVTGTSAFTGNVAFAGATTFTGAVVMSTALPIASGGTGASTAGNARTNLSVASSGANSDITSLTGLTTALSAGQGGTGLTAPGTSGNVLTSNGSAWTSSTPNPLVLIKSTSYTNSTRTSVATTADSADRNIQWTVSVVKSSSTSKLLVFGFLPYFSSNNGAGTWHIRINSGTYQFAGFGSYNPSQMATVTINSYLDTSSLAAGTYNIDIAWSTATSGKPYNIWNPNSTDNANELFYQTASQLTVMEMA